MSNLVENIGLKRKEDLSGFDYKFDSSTAHDFVQFIFRLVNDNKDNISWNKESSLKDPYEFRIIIHTPDILFIKENPKDIIDLGDHGSPKMPILHIVVSDFFNDNLYDDKPLYFKLPRYFQYMDNSIWNYYVPMTDFNKENDECFQNLFNNAVAKIYDNYVNNIYELTVAEEYADLNARILKQSYLSSGGSGKPEGHAKFISPFIFHSETAIEKLIEKNCKRMKKGYGKDGSDKEKYRCEWLWRFLLVDDKAIEFKNNEPIPNCKMSIIKRLIERALFNEREDKGDCVQYRKYDKDNEKFPSNGDLSKAVVVIDCVSSFDDAVKVLKKYKYDLILLDYLLDGGTNRNYGYELLKDIDKVIDTSSNEYKKGLSEQLFFIFISAYTTAVSERLLAQGLNRSEKYWYIDTGACPTNTPQLFTYSLLKLMEKRLEDSGIWSLSSHKIFELIEKIFSPQGSHTPNSNPSLVRERARNNYYEVLNLHNYFYKMLMDVQVPDDYDENEGSLFNIDGSVLATHFMLKNQKLGGLLEHLVHLVHLAGFGTIRQWAEMWEEYIYIRAYFEERLFSNTVKNDFKDVCKNIEEYIFDLKSQQR